MFLKSTRVEWRPNEGVLIIYGDGDAKDGIAIPIKGISKLNAEAMRYLSGQEAKQHDQSQHGPFHFAELCTARTYNVGLTETTNGEKVTLVLDRGLDTQIGFAIEPEHARELGHELAETADRASKSPPAKN